MITLILLHLALKPRLPLPIFIIRRPPLRVFAPVHYGAGFEEDEGADEAEAGGHEYACLGVGALYLPGMLVELITSQAYRPTKFVARSARENVRIEEVRSIPHCLWTSITAALHFCHRRHIGANFRVVSARRGSVGHREND